MNRNPQKYVAISRLDSVQSADQAMYLACDVHSAEELNYAAAGKVAPSIYRPCPMPVEWEAKTVGAEDSESMAGVVAVRTNEAKIGTCLAGLLWLPAVWACSPGSAASPAPNARAVAASESNVGDVGDRTAAARSSLDAEPQISGTAASPESTDDAPSSATPAAPDSEIPAPPAGQRPPADRTPRRPGEAEKITFEDLDLPIQADVVFRPIMLTDRVNELAGRRVSIAGYMHPGQSAQRGIKKFILLKNTQCKFGPGGEADHLADIILRNGVTTGFTPSPVKVEGTLKIEPFQGPDGNTWSIYRLEDARIH